jgi:predicted DNA-binding transcriptional regulator AlpA
MPARKQRQGADLEQWERRKAEHQQRLATARMTVQALSGHSLLRLDEAAAMLGTTKKSLRENEAKIADWPRRVTISPKITGYRLMDVEAFIASRLASAEVEADA